MNDPYQTLGISRGASDDEVKKAYRTLSRKYHPDSNIGKSASERAAAEEKFKEVQAAYKAIVSGEAATQSYTSTSSSSSGGPYGGGFSGYSGYNYGSSRNQTYNNYSSSREDYNYYTACENYLRNRMYQEAYYTLNNVKTRDDRWYYYSAMANAGMGNQTTALQHIQIAIKMAPMNQEYRRFAQRLSGAGDWYTEVGRNYGAQDVGGSDFCVKLFLFSMLCQCCGGGSFCCGPMFYI